MNTIADTQLIANGFETPSLRMVPHWKVSFIAPHEDVDRLFEEILMVTDLSHGKTDQNAYLAPEGYEYYRPLEGTPTGAEEDTRKRPGINQMFVVVPQDRSILEKVIEAIYAVHSYYEPVIIVYSVLRSQTKGLDDSDNPHRWWNKSGDWATCQS